MYRKTYVEINIDNLKNNVKNSIDKEIINMLIYILLPNSVAYVRRGGRVGLWHQS